MTIEFQCSSGSLKPFLLRFAEPLPETTPQKLRYDVARQVAQVLVNGSWVDTPDALDSAMHSTRVTKVVAETTDDQ